MFKFALILAANFIIFGNIHCFNSSIARIDDIHSVIRLGYGSCRQIVQEYLNRIHKFGRLGATSIGAIATINGRALSEADALDRYYRMNGRFKGRLHCVPLLVKDSIDVAGLPTTNGLLAFKDQIPLKDATVVKNCRDQGAVILAKANMSPLSDKEAWGNSENFGLIKNPWALNYTTYGSSGGNAAGAAAMLAIGGIGAETGVSINLPASANGVVGLRPPVELLKSHNGLDGVMPNSHFQDTVGPIARLAEDAVAILDGMLGRPGLYASSILDPLGLDGARINSFDLFAYGNFSIAPGMHYEVDPKIQELYTEAVANMMNAGAVVGTAGFNLSAIGTVLMMFGASYSSCVAGWRDEYFNDTERFSADQFQSFDSVVASETLPPYYQDLWLDLQSQANVSGRCEEESNGFLALVDMLKTDVIGLLFDGDADVVMWPTLPSFPAKLGHDARMKHWDSPTRTPINLVLLASWTGYPSITIPMGFSDPEPDAPQGLPIGLFMMATPEKFPSLLKIAYAYQENFGSQKLPRLATANPIPEPWSRFPPFA